MDNSSSSHRSQRPATGRRERVIPSTPRTEILTPPTPQSMELPTASTSQPPETSAGKMYLEILTDVMGKFNPTDKMSEIFAHLAAKFKEEEEQPYQVPTEVQTSAAAQAGRPLTEQSDEVGHLGTEKEAVQVPSEEDDQAERNSEGSIEVIVCINEDSEFDEVTLDERARRRNLRASKREEMVEMEGKLVESATKAMEEFQQAERKRKGKHIATPGTKRRPDQTLKGVVIREPTEDLTIPPYYQTGEQRSVDMEVSDSEGFYEKLEVTLDQELLEAMVYFKDPKKRKECAVRRQRGKKAKSGKRLHKPSLR